MMSNPRPRSTAQVPHGGWVFHQGDIRIVGFTGADLQSRVLAHRANNKLDRTTSGEVEEDVWSQICGRDPDWCVEPDGPSFKDRIESFAHTAKMFFDQGMIPVDQEEANRRAAICINCPKNVSPTAEPPCAGCQKTASSMLTGLAYKVVDGIRALVIPGKSTPHDAKLRACQVCGCDNKLSVWIPKEAFVYPPEVQAAFPDFCWKK